jgi:hypothetical protein
MKTNKKWESKPDKRIRHKPQLRYRKWIKENGKYILSESLDHEEEIKEYSLSIYDPDGKEIYEFDMLEDEKGIYLVKFYRGRYIKHYKSGEVEDISIFNFQPDRIVGNKIERGMI